MERLAIFNPVNGIFGANFTPWPQKGYLRAFSGQIFGVSFLSGVRGVLERGKNGHFWQFLAQN